MTRLYAYALIDAPISLADLDDLPGLALMPAPAGYVIVRSIAATAACFALVSQSSFSFEACEI